jgi:hypothetical protein
MVLFSSEPDDQGGHDDDDGAEGIAQHVQEDATHVHLGQRQGCQMVYFLTKNPNLVKIFRALDWKTLIYIFYGHMGYFTDIWEIWYILCSLVTFFRFWYHASRKIWQPWAARPAVDFSYIFFPREITLRGIFANNFPERFSRNFRE